MPNVELWLERNSHDPQVQVPMRLISLTKVGDRPHNAKKTLCYVSRGKVKCFQSLCFLNEEKDLAIMLKKKFRIFLLHCFA